MVIDELLKKENYSIEKWSERGLNPSPITTIEFMEKETKIFLIELKKVSEETNLSLEEKNKKVTLLVDKLPWYDLDTEEKEFLADVLAPAIESLGLEPWSIF